MDEIQEVSIFDCWPTIRTTIGAIWGKNRIIINFEYETKKKKKVEMCIYLKEKVIYIYIYIYIRETNKQTTTTQKREVKKITTRLCKFL